MTAPKPCPVCGGRAFVIMSQAVHGSWVWCDDRTCCVTGPQRPTEAEAVAAWNRLAEAVGKANAYDATHTGDFIDRAHAVAQRVSASNARHYGRDVWHICVEEAERAAALPALVEALQEIEAWSRAYPLEVFPEPDLKRVAEVLSAAGLTLDSVSASNMRHVVTGVGEKARAALALVKGETT